MTPPPDWVRDLLGLWAHRDWTDAQQDLGFPTVSPMFAKAVGCSIEAEDVTGFSSAEMRAMNSAIEWLQLEHHDHWRALSRELRPWTRRTLEAKPGDQALALEAASMIEKFIDDLLQ
jgi:hypothetical protein